MADNWLCDYNDWTFNRHKWHTETLTKLEYYVSRYTKLKEITSILQAWAIVIIILGHANVLMASKAPRANTSLVLMIATATGNANLWQRLPEAIQ